AETPPPPTFRSERVVLMPILSRYAFTMSAVKRSRIIFVAVLSLSTIIRCSTSRKGNCTPSEISLAMIPLPGTFAALATVSGSVQVALPRDGIEDRGHDRQLDRAGRTHRVCLVDAHGGAGVEILRVEGNRALKTRDSRSQFIGERIGGASGGEQRDGP